MRLVNTRAPALKHATAPAVPGSAEFTAVSPSLAVTNLAYTGTVLATSGTVTFTALRFTADQLDASGLTITDPCVTNPALTTSFKVTQTVASTDTATIAGPVVLLATSLSFTPAGGPTVTYDTTTPPTVGVLVASGTLPQVEITAADLTAASVTAPLRQQVGPC